MTRPRSSAVRRTWSLSTWRRIASEQSFDAEGIVYADDTNLLQVPPARRVRNPKRESIEIVAAFGTSAIHFSRFAPVILPFNAVLNPLVVLLDVVLCTLVTIHSSTIPNGLSEYGRGFKFDLNMTPENASLLGGSIACPHCKRHGGQLKSQRRISAKLFAAKLLFRGTGVGPTRSEDDGMGTDSRY
jgi:hypothetical protein